MGSSTSNLVFRCINFLIMLSAFAVVAFGAWMSTHHDNCRKSLTTPVMGMGGFIFIVSLIGLFGALKNNETFLWIYLTLLCIILVTILALTVLAFIVIKGGSGHEVPGLRYKEYKLEDYSVWFVKQLNDTNKWSHLRSCLVQSYDCTKLQKLYKNKEEYRKAKLTPIEAGCCRPPSECGYPALNASFYDLNHHPRSSSKDCKLYKNSKSIKCYNCSSCKAGVAQYMKTEWRVFALLNLTLFLVLLVVYCVGCFAKRSAAMNRHKL